MGRKLKVVYLCVDEGRKAPEEREILDDVDEFHRLIKCDAIDIVRREICGKYFRIVCDDEGFLKEAPLISAVSEKMGFQPLAGNIIIAGCENAEHPDELTDLSDDDVELILSEIRYIKMVGHYMLRLSR